MIATDMQSRWSKNALPQHAGWTWRILETLYTEPHRKYHTLLHIGDCLSVLDVLETPVQKQIVEVALWWHDAVYVPGERDNEMNSVALFDAVAGNLNTSDDEDDVIRSAIYVTESHELFPAHVIDSWTEKQAVIDIDLAILGAHPARYAHYAQSVREEYEFVSDEVWRAGRSTFLRKTLGKPAIFGLEEMRHRFDAQARENMASELETLSRSGR